MKLQHVLLLLLSAVSCSNNDTGRGSTNKTSVSASAKVPVAKAAVSKALTLTSSGPTNVAKLKSTFEKNPLREAASVAAQPERKPTPSMVITRRPLNATSSSRQSAPTKEIASLKEATPTREPTPSQEDTIPVEPEEDAVLETPLTVNAPLTPLHTASHTANSGRLLIGSNRHRSPYAGPMRHYDLLPRTIIHIIDASYVPIPADTDGVNAIFVPKEELPVTVTIRREGRPDKVVCITLDNLHSLHTI